MISTVMQISSMSLQAVLIIGVVFGIQKLFALGHIPKKYVMILWMIPFFFLVFPWKIPVPRGFWNRTAVEFDAGFRGTDEVDGKKDFMDAGSGAGSVSESQQEQISGDLWNSMDNAMQSLKDMPHTEKIQDVENAGKSPDIQGDFLQKLLTLGEGKYRTAAGVWPVIWAAGTFCFFSYGLVGYWRLKRKVLCSIKCDDGKEDAVYLTDGIQTPVVLGYVNPRIYLPAGIHTPYRDYVVAHENTHIRRKDYITKAAAYCITCLHWFNPAVWSAYYFMAKDMEMACDEETVSKIGVEKRKEYASALLELSAGTGSIFAVPPAFGEGDIKPRIQNIMRYKGTAKRTAATAIAVGIFLTGIFLTADEQGFTRTAAKASEETDGGQELLMAGQQNTGRQNTGQQNTGRQNTGQQNIGRQNTAQGENAGNPGETVQSEILTFEMIREAFAGKAVGLMDFSSYKNGRKKEMDEYASNYYIDFYLNYENEMYRLGLSFDKSNDRLGDIYITRNSDSLMRWIYTVDEEEGEKYPNDLEVFLRTRTTIDDWLTLELPEGYTLGSYDGDVGECGGALIFPKVYQTQEGEYSDFAPEHWKYAGCVGKVADPQGGFAYVDGKLDEQHYPRANHSSYETEGVMDTISAGLGWNTLMVYGSHDLYTAADLGEMETEGVDVGSLETESGYWYFYFVPAGWPVKEGEENAYFLSLSAKEFTKTEAIDIARTVKITEDESALQRKKAIQHVLDVYFSDFMNALLEDSSREYGRNEFASIDGYIAGKWITSRREIYKKEHGGIRSADLKGAELLQLKEKEGQMEALVHVSYRFAWGNTKEDACDAGCLFRVVLEQSGSSWQVVDLECCDCVEIMVLKDQMERLGDDLADRYGFVDDYFGQMWKDAG